jgi:hypothetical protein
MPLAIPVRVTNCHGSFTHLNGAHTLAVTWPDLVRSAILVGYPDFGGALMPPTFQSAWALLFRASIVLAFLQPGAMWRVEPSEPYERADRTEKGAISYYLGMFAAKLAAEKLFNVPFLRHYDTYHQYTFDRPPIGTRPDLLGLSESGDWVVVEAKGRLFGYTSNDLAKAKNQASSVQSIVTHDGSHAVGANLASIAWFDSRRWAIRMDDPNEDSLPLRLDADAATLIAQYYDPVVSYVLQALDEGRGETVTIAGVEFKTVYESALDLAIGVSSEVIESRQVDTNELQRRLRDVMRTIGQPPTSRSSSGVLEDAGGTLWTLGPDGVIVRLGQYWEHRSV